MIASIIKIQKSKLNLADLSQIAKLNSVYIFIKQGMTCNRFFVGQNHNHFSFRLVGNSK